MRESLCLWALRCTCNSWETLVTTLKIIFILQNRNHYWITDEGQKFPVISYTQNQQSYKYQNATPCSPLTQPKLNLHRSFQATFIQQWLEQNNRYGIQIWIIIKLLCPMGKKEKIWYSRTQRQRFESTEMAKDKIQRRGNMEQKYHWILSGRSFLIWLEDILDERVLDGQEFREFVLQLGRIKLIVAPRGNDHFGLLL